MISVKNTLNHLNYQKCHVYFNALKDDKSGKKNLFAYFLGSFSNIKRF